MKQSELKTYLSVIKSNLHKQFEPCKKIAITGTGVISCDLEHWAELQLNTECEGGLYEPVAIEQLKIGVTPFSKTGDLLDFPELQLGKFSEPHTLTDEDIDHIVEAAKNISTDTTRPALQHVALYNGLIAATDGYTLFSTPQSDSLNYFDDETIYLDKWTVTALKRLRKFGTWTISVSEGKVKLTNGVFTIISNQIDALYPKIEELIRENDYSTSITFDTSKVFPLLSKDLTDIQISHSGVVSVSGISTGVVAEIVETPISTACNEVRRVIMPMKSDSFLCVLNGKFLQRLQYSKGELTVVMNSQFSKLEVL